MRLIRTQPDLTSVLRGGDHLADSRDEVCAIKDRYSRRREAGLSRLYDPIDPYEVMARQERERALIRCIRRAGLAPVGGKTVLEIGCGDGANLLDLIRLGFRPCNLHGNELLEDRVAIARSRLPDDVTILPGDAVALGPDVGPFDIVLQSKVFTSILDEDFQAKLARRIWSLVRPGGGVLWFDFTWDNPWNPDVRGVSARRIRELFPGARIQLSSAILAPPLGRILGRACPALYPVLNALPLLRTHVLGWIAKPVSS
jgi:SAM-dependent methyltransferase